MAGHVDEASDVQMHFEDIFRSVLEVLWVLVAEPVIRSLKLEVSWIYYEGTISSQ